MASSTTSTTGKRIKQAAISLGWALAGVVIAILLWEGVKLLGTVITLPIETSDQAMPHVWTIAQGALQPEVRGSDTPVWLTVLIAALYTLLIAFGGFIIGVSVGLLLAIIMQRFAFMERGLLPFVIASQTVPLIALAPLIVGIGNRISFGPFQWGQTQSIMFIAAYLAFFPLSVGALRGLNAATPRSTLWKLRFPASVPYLVPALKVSAAAAVVGTVVAQISTGGRGGIGRLIIEYARETTAQPAKVYIAVIGAILVGLIAAGLVALLDLYLTRNLPKEKLT
jgi:NitT/TauT family transport system permease protein